MRTTVLAILTAGGASILGTPAATSAEADVQRIFASLDENADGQLTVQEAGKQQRLLFNRVLRTSDENRDGRLSAAEFAAGLEPVRAEKEVVEKVSSRLPGSDALVVMLAKMDKNKDRRLDPKEIPADYLGMFEVMVERGDANKDGRLDSREIAQGAPQLGLAATMGAARLRIDVPAELAKLPKSEMASLERMDAYGRPGEMMSSPEQAAEMFTRIDANGDNFLSVDEVPGPFAKRLELMLPRIDRDGDGKLSKAEFTEFSRRVAAFERTPVDPEAVNRTVRQLLRRHDANGDGQLSVQEVPRRMAGSFNRNDRDANGQLDEGELEPMAQAIGRFQRGGMRPGAGFGPPGRVDERSDKSVGPAGRAKSAGANRRKDQRKRSSQD